MNRVPSFRPRADLGFVDGRRVKASPEFLRWLDQLVRQTDAVTVTYEQLPAPVGKYAQTAPQVTFAAYPSENDVLPTGAYDSSCEALIYGDYS
jgi:hypothetical protein